MPIDLRRETLNIQIANIIKQEIIQGILKQGERLDLKKLIERFQVSSIPIREALKKLESEGFIESASRRGYFVRSYTDRDIEEIGEARLMVESYCLSKYFDTIDQKTLKEIYAFMEKFPETALDEYIGKDFNFHNLIVECSKNDFIINFYSSLQEKIHFFMSIQEDLDTFRAQHLKIMQFIFSGEKDQATQILREHILYSTQVIKNKLFQIKSDKKIKE